MPDEKTKKCNFCESEVSITAKKCRYCGEWLSDSPPSSGSVSGIQLVQQALGNRYEIQHEIGRGGMATVYKAIQKNLNRPVALKVIHQNLLHDTEFVARFHREAQICASLQHPNIVTVYDEGEVSGVHFMAMEYLEGQDLRQLIRSRGKLTPEQTLQYLLPVAEALEYAHAEGLIHRDIKSANIYITNKGRVVLMDFGIAHAAAGTQLTRAGTVIGTPEYMSPEQADGRQVDARTDLYSLGVVIYECLTGRVPFTGDNAASIIYRLVHEQPDDTHFNFIPKGAKALTMSLLSKNPEHRPKSGGATAQAIRLLQQGKEWQPLIKSQQSQTQSQPEKTTLKLSTDTGPGSSIPPKTPQVKSVRKKVPGIVWLLVLIGIVLIGVLLQQQNKATQENRRLQYEYQQALQREKEKAEAEPQKQLDEQHRSEKQEDQRQNQLKEPPQRKQQVPEQPQKVQQPALQLQKEQQDINPPRVDPRALYQERTQKIETRQSEGINLQASTQNTHNVKANKSDNEASVRDCEGISFSLSGRSAIILPQPEYLTREQGRVVVTIWVDKQGNVLRVSSGARGTTTTDPVLRKAAEESALRSRFSHNQNAPDEQTGTITFNFLRKHPNE